MPSETGYQRGGAVKLIDRLSVAYDLAGRHRS